jgi:hypothetical protein
MSFGMSTQLTGARVLRRHLLTLSHLKGTTVCALADIDASLARVAGVGRACTVGIRKLDEGETRSEIAGSLLDHVCARAIPTSIPWLPTAARSQRHAGAGYGTARPPSSVWLCRATDNYRRPQNPPGTSRQRSRKWGFKVRDDGSPRPDPFASPNIIWRVDRSGDYSGDSV